MARATRTASSPPGSTPARVVAAVHFQEYVQRLLRALQRVDRLLRVNDDAEAHAAGQLDDVGNPVKNYGKRPRDVFEPVIRKHPCLVEGGNRNPCRSQSALSLRDLDAFVGLYVRAQ